MTWVEAPIVARTDWADGLFSVRIGAALADFEPGQWINISLDGRDADRVKRAYSLASPPGKPPELYLVRVEGGALTPRLERMAMGEPLWLDDQPRGFFTLRHLPPARELWLMGTGTGLAPFVSMVESGALWSGFERIVLVHGVRLLSHLGYRDVLEAAAAAHPHFAYLPVVSREQAEGVTHGRITGALERGILERAAGLPLDPARSHVMLCGNPAMIGDMMALLEARGLRKHRVRRPGHVTFEKYW